VEEQTDRQMDGQMYGMDRLTEEGQTDEWMNRLSGGQTDNQADGQTSRQIGRQTDKRWAVRQAY
jgi:hypothetical protein